MPTEYNDVIVTGSIIDDTIIGQYVPSTGYFNRLELNGTGVSISGHTHSYTSIVDLGSGVSGIVGPGISGISLLGEIPSGIFIYSTGVNSFTTGVITDYALSLLDDEDINDVRSTLGLSSLTTVSGVLVLGSDVAQDVILSDVEGSGTIFNNRNRNIDFIVKGSGDADRVLFYDASMGRLGINTQAPDHLVHMVSTCALDGFKIETTTNCTTGVHLYMLHNPGSTPVDGSYNGTISMAGRDHNGNEIDYAKIRALAASTDNNTTSGTFGELHAFIDENAQDSQVLRLSREAVLLGASNVIQTDSLYYNLMGSGNVASGNYFVVIGTNNSGTLNHSGIMIGSDNIHSDEDSRSLGRDISSYGTQNSLVGYMVWVSGDVNYVYGSNVVYSGDYGILIGDNNEGSGSYTVGIGQDNYNFGISNVLIGSDLINDSNKSVLIGNNSDYTGNSGVIIGENISVTGDKNVVIGNNIDLVSTGLFICGQDVSITNVKDSLILEKNVTVSDASGIVVVGRGNAINSTNNIAGIYGYQNISSNSVDKTNVLGSENAISNISGSLVVGSENYASGTVRNTVSIGRHNYFNGNTYNNILVGNLNNQSGYQIVSNGTITGSSYDNNNPIINTIAVGNQNIFPHTGNMMLAVGNKNKINSNGVVVVGHLNSTSGDNTTLLGRSNFSIGADNILMGNSNNLFGNSNVVLSPRDTDVYGQNNIVLGNNTFVSNGIVLGNTNVIYGDNNSVVGRQNDIGDTRYPFTATINTNLVTSLTISGSTDFKAGDSVVVYLTNPVGTDGNNKYTFYRTIATNGVTFDSGTNITVVTFSDGTIPVRTTSVNSRNNFDENFSTVVPTTATGYVVRFNHGSSNYVYGDNNTIASGTGNLIVGRNNTVTQGLNNILIGDTLSVGSSLTNNTMIIGPSNNKRLILGDNIVFNSGLGYNNIYFVGTDNVAYANFDTSNNRLGVGTSAPRSTLDVSGVVTAQGLRLGLSSDPNLELATSSDGTITAVTRTMFSGTTYGMVCRLNNNIGSGIPGFRYDEGTDTYTWYNVQPDSVNTVPGLTITPNYGATFNASNNYFGEEFNLKIIGSGTSENDIDAPVLFNTEYLHNRIVMYNTVADTGVFKGDVRVTGLLYLPSLQTDGSVLRINSDGDIESNKLLASTIPTVTTDYKITGYQTMRYFGDEKVFCLAKTDVADHATLTNTFVNSEYNIILSNNIDQETIFNRQGEPSHLGSGFVVLYDGSDRDGDAFRIDYTNKQVGINTSVSDLEDHPNVGPDYGASLVVKGGVYAEALRIGTAATAGDVLVTDANGNITSQTFSLGLASNTLRYPLVIDVDGDTEYLALSSSDEDGNALDPRVTSVDDIGRMLAWNGDSSSWCSTSHLRAFKGDTDGNRYRQILFGDHASNAYITTQNAHISSAGSFHSTAPTYRGSSQSVEYHLRGSGTGNTITRLYTDWSIDNSSPSASRQNQIAIPGTSESQDLFCWHYEAIVNAIGKNTSDNSLKAATIKVEGMFESLDANRTLYFSPANVNRFYHSNSSDLANIGVELKADGNTIGVVNISCTGIADYHIMWSAVVKVNQISLPSF